MLLDSFNSHISAGKFIYFCANTMLKTQKFCLIRFFFVSFTENRNLIIKIHVFNLKKKTLKIKLLYISSWILHHFHVDKLNYFSKTALAQLYLFLCQRVSLLDVSLVSVVTLLLLEGYLPTASRCLFFFNSPLLERRKLLSDGQIILILRVFTGHR